VTVATIELIFLALASAAWPLLLAVVFVALRSPHPVRLLASFLTGGLLTSILVGTAAALALQETSLVAKSRPSADPAVYLIGGAAAMAVAILVRRRPPRTKRALKPHRPTLYERAMQRGAILSFVAGIVLNVVPGVFPLIALKDVAQLGYGAALTATVITAFYVVMFALVEVPLIGYVVAPERTKETAERASRWLTRNGRRLVAVVLEIVAAYLILRGAITLLL
jgi:hypothetical protein